MNNPLPPSTPASGPIRKSRRRSAPSKEASGKHDHADQYSEAIARSGIRLTSQRRHVFEALMETRDHPTALDVFMRVKTKVPSISLATVYNCLEALSESGLIKPVSLDRGSARYCANALPHGHFYCNDCGAVIDIPLHKPLEESWEVPAGIDVTHVELTLRGHCSGCARKL